MVCVLFTTQLTQPFLVGKNSSLEKTFPSARKMMSGKRAMTFVTDASNQERRVSQKSLTLLWCSVALISQLRSFLQDSNTATVQDTRKNWIRSDSTAPLDLWFCSLGNLMGVCNTAHVYHITQQKGETGVSELTCVMRGRSSGLTSLYRFSRR